MSQVKILIVEDKDITALELQGRLEECGYVVPAVVSTGAQAIQKAVETTPDLVLIDIILKGKMDGIEAAEQIRTRLDIPVVFLTAHDDERTLQRAKVITPYDYILKPFEERELYIIIKMALYKHKVEQELWQHRDHLEKLVQERTRELEAAQEELVRRERLTTLGQLTAVVSHELRTPWGLFERRFSYSKNVPVTRD